MKAGDPAPCMLGAGGNAGVSGMNARLEKKLRLLAFVVAAGTISGIAFNAAQGRSLAVGIAYGLLVSLVLGSIELFTLEGPMRPWLGEISPSPPIWSYGARFTARLSLSSNGSKIW